VAVGGTAVLAASMEPGDAWLGGALSVAAAFVYTFGLALQQKGNLASAADREPDEGRVRTVVRVVTHPLWLAGFILGLLGFTLHGVALHIGALTIVQLLQVTQLVFMVPLSAWVARVALRARDWLGAALVGIGLLGFLAAVRPGDDTRDGSRGEWLIAGLACALAVLALVAASRGLLRWRAALLGAASGVAFGFEAATLKVAADDLAGGVTISALLGIAVWTTLVVGIVGVLLQNLALRAGSLAVAQASMTIATPVVATALGATLFGETLQRSALTVVAAVAAAAVALAGVALLARSTAFHTGQPAARRA
jgi:drug/metabolite transporter (DMT)-like permease